MLARAEATIGDSEDSRFLKACRAVSQYIDVITDIDNAVKATRKKSLFHRSEKTCNMMRTGRLEPLDLIRWLFSIQPRIGTWQSHTV